MDKSVTDGRKGAEYFDGSPEGMTRRGALAAEAVPAWCEAEERPWR